MKYNVSFCLTSPDKIQKHQIKCIVDIAESGAFSYGNGKSMAIDYSQSREIMGENQYIDIRYDRRYSSKYEKDYIKQFIKSTYDGEAGTWKATYITVK